MPTTPPAAPSPTPAQRRAIAPIVATALFVVVAVLAILVVHARQGPGTAPAPRSADRVVVVPAVLGARPDDADRKVRQAGLRLSRHPRQGCTDLVDRITGADPLPGTEVARDSLVTLEYAEPGPSQDCAYTAAERAWDFLDWARGQGKQPARLESIDLFGPGDGARPLTRSDPASSWPYATAIARAATGLVATARDHGRAQPRLSAQTDTCDDTGSCVAESMLRVQLRLEGAPAPYAAFEILLDADNRISGYRLVTAPGAA